jgi:carboxyl-terminal processing protease
MMRRLVLAAGAASVVLLAPAGAAPPSESTSANTSNGDTYKALDLFAQVFERVRQDYVEPVPDDQLVENAISGMLSSLDPHSSYMNEKNFKSMQVEQKGEFGGLGVEVVGDNGFVRIVAPMDDTPGAKAGLKSGDLIVAIDGEPLVNATLDEAVEKMRGAPNTSIKLTIKREGQQPFDVSLTRAVIHVAAVRGRIERDNIAYIRIPSFLPEHLGTEMEAKYKDLKTQAGGKLGGLVLDLRADPGGLLDQAIAVSDDFLDHGEIVSTRGRRPEDVQRYNAHPGDITNGLPIVVLIDGGTASASEIVAGALQDHHRAVIMGTRSFGKGSVQTIIPLAGAGAMRLTTARYFTPSGRSIQGHGIDPDILVEPAKLEKIALGDRPHESDLKGALKNPNDPTASAKKPDTTKPEATPAAAADPSPKDGTAPKDAAQKDGGPNNATLDQIAAAGAPEDYQLSRALDLLKGVALFNAKAVD